MKNILIPFDFSDISINAMNFAFNLHPKAKFRIVHITYRGSDLGKPALDIEGKTQQALLEESILNVVINQNKGIIPLENIELIIDSGAKVERILKHAENFADGIVMGTRDSYGILDRWIGTVSLGVVKQAMVPVYLIPKYSRVKDFENIVVASDFHLNSKVHVNNLVKWNQDYLAHISFVHLNQNFENDFEKEKINLINYLFENSEPKFGFQIVSKKVHEGPSTLLSIAYNLKSDLIVMIPSKQKLFESLFFKSFSKAIILKSSIPLLFFPNNEYKEAFEIEKRETIKVLID